MASTPSTLASTLPRHGLDNLDTSTARAQEVSLEEQNELCDVIARGASVSTRIAELQQCK